jgi:hypothetical protein
LREIGVGSIRRGTIFRATGLRLEKARGQRKKGSEGSGGKKELATGICHRNLPESDAPTGVDAKDGTVVEQGSQVRKREAAKGGSGRRELKK